MLNHFEIKPKIGYKISFIILLIFSGCSDFQEYRKRQQKKRIKEQNKIYCETQLNISIEGVVDSIFRDHNYNETIRLRNGFEFNPFALQQAFYLLKVGDRIYKPAGKFEYIITPVYNPDSTFHLFCKNGFDCNYWESLEELKN